MDLKQIEEHVREELYRWAMLPGNGATHDEALEFVEENLVRTLCAHINSALICMELAVAIAPEEFQERISNQLSNWG